MKHGVNAKLASLFRELAEVYENLDAEQKPRRGPRVLRERTDRAAEDAVRRVQNGLRKQGIRS